MKIYNLSKILTSLTFVILLAGLSNSYCKEIIVSKDGKINSVKVAINVAEDGDTIFIKKGLYKESLLKIKKSISLIGVDNPVLDGENKNEIMLITADNVVVKGITFKNAGKSFINDNAAIKLDGVKKCLIENNKLIDNFFGIYLSKTADTKIINNHITANQTRETSSGNGIHLWYSKNITIEDNYIKGHRDGIYFEFVENGHIKNNFSENNLRYGLHFMFSDNCSYVKNTFKDNGAGVAVMYTKNVKMHDNFFINNWGGASYGLLLKEISDSKIYNNSFYKNTTGIYLEACNRILVEQNDFEENGWAIKIMANCVDNNFTRNNFITNSFDVATNSKQNFNHFNKNYWANYDGYDLDKNGIGDVPYHPVKLFSMMVEQQSASLVLLHSLFIDILNLAESVLPSITPETLIDENPLMRKVK